MWRKRDILGPKPEIVLTGRYLYDLIDRLNQTVRTNHAARLSGPYDVSCIAPGLYLGNKFAAKSKQYLVRNGFTHVLNAAEGFDEHQVNTDEYYYKDVGIEYKGIPGRDTVSWDISIYFEEAAKFIHDALKQGGKILVHCVVGISRSATLVIAYLMLYKDMRADDAISATFNRRPVFPNSGFLDHLARLNTRLLISRRSSSLVRNYYNVY